MISVVWIPWNVISNMRENDVLMAFIGLYGMKGYQTYVLGEGAAAKNVFGTDASDNFF